MHQQTKSTRLIIRLMSGLQLSGRFHMAKETIAAVRPSDAIGECRGGFILLSDVDVSGTGESSTHSSIMVQIGDISYIKLPESWKTDGAPDVVHEGVSVS